MHQQLVAKGDSSLLTIRVLGYSDENDPDSFGPGRRSFYIIYFILSGSGFFNGHPVKAGEGFLITPGMTEEHHPDENDPWRVLWVLSSDERILPFYERCAADPQTGIFSCVSLQAAEEVTRCIMDKCGPLYDALYVLELFLHLFHQNGLPTREEKRCATDMYFEYAVEYIHTNIHSPLTVGSLIDFLGVSQPYLYRIFMEKAWRSPKQYIRDAKLAEAKRFLRETDIPITDVAHSVGFSDVLHFSKFFSIHVGMSPKAFRSKK